MKKLALALVAAAAVGYVAYRKFSDDRAEQDLWTEATAPVDLR